VPAPAPANLAEPVAACVCSTAVVVAEVVCDAMAVPAPGAEPAADLLLVCLAVLVASTV
jgi:hypothetical protein